MQTVKAYFDGTAFVPVNRIRYKKYQPVVISVVDESDFDMSVSNSNKAVYTALPKKAVFGSGKGKIYISDDFDQPLAEFANYM